VVKCQRIKTGELVAVKVIKNQPAYFNQSMMEVTVLELLNGKHDPHDRHHIVRMKDTFIFRQHLCVVVELLSLNLYELIKQNQYRGFSLQLCRVFLAQILDAMRVLKEAKIVHCDLKPENILLKSLDSPGIKVIDYGSACHEQQTLYTYIQSRFYRSPEVLLGLPYTAAIDMWSLGCIAAELFLGLPIFPGASGYDQMARIVETLSLPPTHMLELGRDAALYFDKRAALDGRSARYTLKSRERYAMETGKQEPPSKKYFASANLEDMVLGYAFRPKDMPPADKELEMRQRRVFVDFLRGLLKLNPVERWHPQQALQHPFITGKTAPVLVPQPVPPLPIGMPAIPQTRQRPRANTLSSLSLQDVPPQIQKIASAANKGPAGVAKPAARQPPPEIPVDTEPPALPFEVGSVKSQGVLSPPGSAHAPPDPAKTRAAKQGYYVDRLATYTTNRRVSNPPGMMSIRSGRRSQGRVDSLSLDDFPGPSSLPTVLPAWSSGPEPGSSTTEQSPRRASASRRASDPFVAASSYGGAQPIRAGRKGSLSFAAGAAPPSSLSRSLTMSDMHNQTHHNPPSSSSTSMAAMGTSGTGSSSSSSYNMDTLEEVSESEDHPTHHPMDAEPTDPLDKMDIDY
jgi:serine/threonine protein kinase